MNSIVTQRFIQCHHQLKQDNRVRSSRQFALALDYLPQSLSEILKGRRDVTIDLLRKAVEVYQVNPLFLYTGEGEMFLKSSEEKELRVLAVVTNAQHDERILHIPGEAQADYAQGSANPEFIRTLPTLSLPDRGSVPTQRSFDVKENDMEPTFWPGDKVICDFVEPSQWEEAVKNNHVYVLVSRDAVTLSRVRNELKTQQNLSLRFDNPYVEALELPRDEIQEIWQVHTRICPFQALSQGRPAPIQEEVKALREMLAEQQQMIQNLHHTIEKLINS
jgi:transcriptional regulator with XRE-family HTH domain